MADDNVDFLCRSIDISIIIRIILYYVIIEYNCCQGRPQDLGGGGAKNFLFQIWEFACREATCCAWRSHAHC